MGIEDVLMRVYCLGALFTLGWAMGNCHGDPDIAKEDIMTKAIACLIAALLWPSCLIGRYLWHGSVENDKPGPES